LNLIALSVINYLVIELCANRRIQTLSYDHFMLIFRQPFYVKCPSRFFKNSRQGKLPYSQLWSF
jgi:hypothetical protein